MKYLSSLCLLLLSFSLGAQISPMKSDQDIKSEQNIKNNEFEVKSGGGSSKFRRITINEKAIKNLVKRLGKLEAKVKKLESQIKR